MDPLLDGLPPHDSDAERAVLGCMLRAHYTVDEIVTTLSPGDFYHHQHETAYRAIVAVHDRNEPVDLITVKDQLLKVDPRAAIDLTLYLSECQSETPDTYAFRYYANIVKKTSERRKTITLGQRIAELGHDPEVTSPLDKAAGMAVEACTTTGADGAHSMADIAPDLMADVDAAMAAYAEYGGRRIPGRILTGLHTLDELTLGVGVDHLIYVGARPAMGKSSFLFQVGKQIAQGLGNDEPLPVIAFSLEMGRKEIMRRLACSMSGINGRRVIRGEIGEMERLNYEEAVKQLIRIPLNIDDSADISLSRIRAEARKVKARNGGKLGAVLVDYIQLMGASKADVARFKKGNFALSANRQEEISELSRGLKVLARELQAPVIAAAQLNRSLESRPNKRPMLADLRESGSLEQDANQVWFLYRDEVYNPDTNDRGICEVIIGKNRDGETGDARLLFDKATTTFSDLSPSYAPRPAVAPRTATEWRGTEVQELGEEFA